MKTIRRDWLLKQIDAGKMEAKCNFHLTDDYAADNANQFGKTDWIPARICRPQYGTRLLDDIERSVCIDPDFIEGQMNFHASDFTGKPGRAWTGKDETIVFKIHSNAIYTLRFKQTIPVPAKPRIRLYPTVVQMD